MTNSAQEQISQRFPWGVCPLVPDQQVNWEVWGQSPRTNLPAGQGTDRPTTPGSIEMTNSVHYSVGWNGRLEWLISHIDVESRRLVRRRIYSRILVQRRIVVPLQLAMWRSFRSD